MPGELDGRSLARKMAEARPETKILLMSGYELHGGHELQEGWHFIRKPFQKTALIQSVQQVLGEPTMMELAD
ncbi:MAG TPA: hypothetical protein VLW65_15620 [Bryobacteraceae bacterium]|nr:hypothetical protein [Bryobacteraceae bacterium]